MLHGMMTMPPVGNDPLAIPRVEILVMVVDEPAGSEARRRTTGSNESRSTSSPSSSRSTWTALGLIVR